jgi:hypothetical protein
MPEGTAAFFARSIGILVHQTDAVAFERSFFLIPLFRSRVRGDQLTVQMSPWRVEEIAKKDCVLVRNDDKSA